MRVFNQPEKIVLIAHIRFKRINHGRGFQIPNNIVVTGRPGRGNGRHPPIMAITQTFLIDLAAQNYKPPK